YIDDDAHIQVSYGPKHKLQQDVRTFQPDILGFYSSTVDFNVVAKLAGEFRDQGFGGLMVIGGHHTTPLPASLRGTVFDAVIRGDAEKAVEQLIKGVPLEEIENAHIKGFKVGSVGKLTEAELPSLNYDKFVRRSEIIWTMTARGCPFRCVFCSTEFEKGYRKLSMDKLIKQIASALKYGQGLGIWDDAFIGESRLDELYDALVREGLLDKIKYMHIQARFCDPLSPDLWERLKRLKVTNINTGFESGSDRILKYLKASKRASVANLKQNTLTALENHINVNGSYMFGAPTETIEDMNQTLDLMRWCQEVKTGKFWFHVATPYPGTEFWDIAKKRGTVHDNMDFGSLSLYDYHNPRLLDASYLEYCGIIDEVKRITNSWFLLGQYKRNRQTGAKGKLTVVVLTKNNGNYIRYCLDNVVGFNGVEVLVCDTGSTDDTVEIVRTYRIRVEHIDWVDDFAAVRNKALEFVETEWALYVDSDMQVGEDFPEIWPLLESNNYDGWKLPHRYYADLERTQVMWPESYPSQNPKLLRV
ncbi:MAG: radical SAM protein, partial [Deltaproteobacteria bacterium]